METIQQKIDRFYNAIKEKEAGKSDSRYKSWEYCHAIFMERHNQQSYTSNDYDLLALHLGFYLASWGMYRGSSFLLQRDYKTHIPVVTEIMNCKYKILWEFDPWQNSIDDALGLLFGNDGNGGLNALIKSAYGDTDSESAEDADGVAEKDEASETLITKILMGTFACVPAFDRFLRAGIANQKKIANSSNVPEDSLAYYVQSNEINNRDLTQSYTRNTCKELMKFVKEKRTCFQREDIMYEKGKRYPPMKCLDMYLWEIGYELSQVEILDKYCNGKSKYNQKKVDRIENYIFHTEKCYNETNIKDFKKRINSLNDETN